MQNALRFLMKKKIFVPLRNNFWSFKKREKKYLSMEKKTWKIKNLFRNQGQFQIRWQCSRNCPPIAFCPHIWKTKNNLSLQKSRAITVCFWDEVFSLSMPSVCPYLTTVCIIPSKKSIWGKLKFQNKNHFKDISEFMLKLLVGFPTGRVLSRGTKRQKFLHCPRTKGQRDKLKILPRDVPGQAGKGLENIPRDGPGRAGMGLWQFAMGRGRTGFLQPVTFCPGMGHRTEGKRERKKILSLF